MELDENKKMLLEVKVRQEKANHFWTNVEKAVDGRMSVILNRVGQSAESALEKTKAISSELAGVEEKFVRANGITQRTVDNAVALFEQVIAAGIARIEHVTTASTAHFTHAMTEAIKAAARDAPLAYTRAVNASVRGRLLFACLESC